MGNYMPELDCASYNCHSYPDSHEEMMKQKQKTKRKLRTPSPRNTVSIGHEQKRRSLLSPCYPTSSESSLYSEFVEAIVLISTTGFMTSGMLNHECVFILALNTIEFLSLNHDEPKEASPEDDEKTKEGEHDVNFKVFFQAQLAELTDLGLADLVSEEQLCMVLHQCQGDMTSILDWFEMRELNSSNRSFGSITSSRPSILESDYQMVSPPASPYFRQMSHGSQSSVLSRPPVFREENPEEDSGRKNLHLSRVDKDVSCGDAEPEPIPTRRGLGRTLTPLHWLVNDESEKLLDFLMKIGLQRYFEELVRNGYDCVENLKCAEKNDLIGLNIKLGHVTMMLNEVKKY